MKKILVLIGYNANEKCLETVKNKLKLFGDCASAQTNSFLLKTDSTTNEIANKIESCLPTGTSSMVVEFSGLAGNNLALEADEWFIRDRTK